MWKPVEAPRRGGRPQGRLTRRHEARSRRKAKTAVVSSSTPGVLQTEMPSSVAVATSMLS